VVSYLVLFVGLATLSGWLGAVLLPDASPNAQALLMEAIRAVPTLAFLVALVGPRRARPSLRGLGGALRLSAGALAVVLLTVAATVQGIVSGVGSSALAELGMTGLASDWPIELAQAVALLALVGVYEEALFRGVLLDTLLGRLGRTRRGLMASALACSLLFGFSHVLPSLLVGDVSSADTIVQAVLKTLQAGMMGMLFCAIVLRSNSLWPSVVVHALCDVGIVVYALYGDVSAVSYVSQDAATGQAMVVVYVMLMVVGLAYLVPATLSLLQVPVPRRCALADGGTGWSGTGGEGASTPPRPSGMGPVPEGAPPRTPPSAG
jgi:membrane protease YdiL (CAAX protease family)